MSRIWLGEVVLDHQPAFRFGLALVIMLLLASNGWYVYSRSLSLADQYAHHAVSGINQHFARIFGFIDTIQSETVNELQWGRPHQNAELLSAALHNPPGQAFYALDTLPLPFTHAELGNLTGLGQVATLDALHRHEIAVTLGMAPMLTAAYRHLGDQGVAWVYYVSKQQFIYIYPFTSSSSYHYSPATAAGQFWRMAQPAVNPEGRRVITPVYIDQAGKGPMLTISQPIWVDHQFRGALCIDVSVSMLNHLLGSVEAPLGSLYLLNAQNQVVAASNEQALPQENLLELPVTAEYEAGAGAHVRVFAVGNTGMRVVHYLPNHWLAREIAKGCAPGMVAALLLWLALLLLLRTWRLNRELRRLSEHDALTGALNHRAFQALLAQLYQAYREHGTVFSLVMVDLDHFKKVNDSFGHAMGDDVLKVLVRLARHLLRSEDKVARLGGEEFVLILPGTDLRDAMKAAVRLRLQLERLNWSKLGLPGKVTASMGCAVVLASDSQAGAVLKRADDAMYRAKQEGRNRVCLDWHGQPPGVQ
jgi:diguanylate cyclase (GGDEF)-like protein